MKDKRAVIVGNTALGYSWFYLTYRQGLKLNGYDVIDIDYKSNSLQNIKKKLISLKVPIVFTHLSFHYNLRPVGNVLQMQREVTKLTGTKFIHITKDARKDDRYMGNIQGAFHMAFVGNHEMRKRGEKAWGIPAFYSPYSSLCYDKMAPVSPDLAFTDPVFTGNPGIHMDRQNFINKLKEKMKIKIFVTQSANDLRKRTPELSSSAKCILGLCTGYDIDGYVDVRPFQYLGAGACMVIRKFKGMDNIIPDDIYFPIDSYNHEAAQKTFEYHKMSLKDTSAMRKKAFDFMQEHHSCKVRIREVLDRIGE